MKEQNQDDQVLIDKFGQSNDQIWLLRLFQKYEHLIYGVCLKYSQDPEWSKDLSAQLYEKLLLKAPSLQTTNFKNWLFGLCKNHCIDQLRKQSRKASALEKFKKFQIQQEAHVEFSQEQRLIIEEQDDKVRIAIEMASKDLSAQQLFCLDLFYIQRLSYSEISQETGMDPQLIKSHLQNGKRRMRRYISSHYKF